MYINIWKDPSRWGKWNDYSPVFKAGATICSTNPPTGCVKLSSLRIYRDQWSILTFVFKYEDGTSHATGHKPDEGMYDDFEFNPNECLVKIEQTMDMDQAHDGDGSGHKRRVTLVTSSGRTLQTTPVTGGAANVSLNGNR